mgnify:CR=1 FL=1
MTEMQFTVYNQQHFSANFKIILDFSRKKVCNSSNEFVMIKIF